MAYFFSGQSHTFNEYLLVPGYSSSECIPDNVSLRTPLTRFRAGEEPALPVWLPEWLHGLWSFQRRPHPCRSTSSDLR